MSNVPIPEDSILAALGGIISAGFLWLLRLERRPRGMTRDDHDKCHADEKRAYREDLRLVMRKLDQQDLKRDQILKEVSKVKVTVAVLASQAATRANQDVPGAK